MRRIPIPHDAIPGITSRGQELDLDEQSFGWLEDSAGIRHDDAALRGKMESDGYIYIRGFFPRSAVTDARMALLKKLNESRIFDPDFPLQEGVLKPGVNPRFDGEAWKNQPAVDRIVFGPEILRFYSQLLCGDIRHFDHVWLRTMGPGQGTAPHCDVVYMGRGTRRLYTAWIPYGEVPIEVGGLMILEKSHLQADRIKNYLESDVDTYCVNIPDRDGWKHGGQLSNNPRSLREKMGGRWLTAEFLPGDFLTFRMDTIHGSIDNRTPRIRLSTDTRYQRRDEPIDERWIGDSPIGHGPRGKRGLIC